MPYGISIDEQKILMAAKRLIAMQRVTLPITATERDFHSRVAAAAAHLGGNYSAYTFSCRDGLTDMHTTICTFKGQALMQVLDQVLRTMLSYYHTKC